MTEENHESFARDLNWTPHDWKSEVLPLAPTCSVICLVSMECTSNTIIRDWCYGLCTFRCICTVVTLYRMEHILMFINWPVGNRQPSIPQLLCHTECYLSWKNPGCHWALILPYVDLNGHLFMTVLHWIMLVFRFKLHNSPWGWKCWKCILCCGHVPSPEKM
jgi:hypothetical protein